jgi:hypothetical protein
MQTTPPQLPGPSPEPPGQSLLPALPELPAPELPAPARPVPTVPGRLRPAPLPLRGPQPAWQRPLPDAVALPSRLPLPAAGPAFDDQAGVDLPEPQATLSAGEPNRAPGGPTSAGAGPGPAARRSGTRPEHAGTRPEHAGTRPEHAGTRPEQAGAPAESAGTPPAQGPDTGAWTSLFAQALAEALAGSRPARQLAPWTTEQARRRIRQLGPMLQAGPRPVVRRVLTSAPHRDVLEMTVIIGVGPRTRAIAVRLERARPNPARPGRGRPWICTVIEAA